jgi:Tfp pilus assembly protein PilX
MSDQSVRERPAANQRGIAMVLALLALLLLLVLSLGILQNSIASFRTAGNDRSAKQALAIAEAGAEYARESLRLNLKNKTLSSLGQALTNAANHGTLVNATLLSAFNGSTGLANGTTNTPFILPTTFAAGNFQVLLTNDRNEPGATSQAASVQSPTDTNSRIMITSFGNAPNGALAAVQEQLGLYAGFLPGVELPGLLVMPGPTVNFQGPHSAARQLNGIDSSGTGCYPTVAVSTNAAKAVVDSNIPKPGDFISCSPFTSPPQAAASSTFNPTTENFLPTASNPYDRVSPNTPRLPGDPLLTHVKYLAHMVASVSAVADFHSTGDAGFTYGSTATPKIVAITGDLSISGNTTGAGVLLVTGTLTLNGTPSYHGVILVIGTGAVVVKGGGNGTFLGAMLIANTATPWITNPAYVGVPSYSDNGGGTATTEAYDTGSLKSYAAAIMPLQVLTFEQLR